MNRSVVIYLLVLFCSTNLLAQHFPIESSNNQVRYRFNINTIEEFKSLQSAPLSNNYAQVDAVKLVYDLKTDKLYFINSTQYKFHYDFCTAVLNCKKDIITFNYTEYGETDKRDYILANLNHFKASDIYTLEFFADDKISANLVSNMYNMVRYNVYFKEQLFLLDNANMDHKLQNIDPKNIISIDEIYANQTYQAMVCEVSYGYLQKVSKKEFDKHIFQTKDIILTDFLPNDIPFCQGIITTKFQTPLSHINVLSQNRKTPNCAYEYAWENSHLNQLIGKLVRYEVRMDSFYITEVSLEEAEKFWKNKTVIPLQQLRCNLKENRLLDIQFIQMNNVNTFGGKASNFGELDKIRLDDESKIPLPEGAFAIPFFYYKQHLIENNIQKQIDFILQQDSIIQNRTLLSYYLKALQDSILSKPLNEHFYQLVVAKLKEKSPYTSFRFRSSTNAEDIEGFTGAGLYTSKTGSLVDSTKKIDQAIKKVWASLWSLRAFEERMNAHINQENLAMGILVHRAFGTEEANGVAITKDLYRSGYPAFTINIQKGENSVVLPKNDEVPEQFLIKFTSFTGPSNDIALDYISHSSLNDGLTLLNMDEIKLLAKYLSAIRDHFFFQLNKQYEEFSIYNFAMDIEFKLDKDSRKLYLKQARTY